MRLESISWLTAKEYFSKKDSVLIPIGSTENHGSHLALGTDFIVPCEIARRIEAKRELLVAPSVNYGVADHHSAFPGTISLGYDGLYLVMSRITEALYRDGARRFFFLNGHGGNDPVLTRLGLELSRRGALTALLNWWQLAPALEPSWKGGHGGGEETAAMLAIDPAYVRFEDILEPGEADLSPALRRKGLASVEFRGIEIPVPRGVDKATASGWYGPDHPAKATAEWGEQMLSAVSDYLADFIGEFEKLPLGE